MGDRAGWGDLGWSWGWELRQSAGAKTQNWGRMLELKQNWGRMLGPGAGCWEPKYWEMVLRHCTGAGVWELKHSPGRQKYSSGRQKYSPGAGSRSNALEQGCWELKQGTGSGYWVRVLGAGAQYWSRVLGAKLECSGTALGRVLGAKAILEQGTGS